ncbi:hypothetical protein M6B22_11140 [Jatrophihabitans cynanchi]|uniref:Uncharacterized protein n=1 Tax=Jatrophihabitans cynanchi TaxID=2944128 RepID=A0ABY7JSW0_9ACTN|nr:hypothetical protein [Jatrophihabitans sp. SB3-54]WAX55115.1 hypothetical protein M6B22_11140 [Jatrophihabitans sp. SB3-54]
MRIIPDPERVRAVLRAALIEHALELGLDPDTVRFPRPNAITAVTGHGQALSVDVGVYGMSR